MKLSDLKKQLATMESIHFRLPNGSLVPEHFHVTEIGQITKKFIDCGGTIRKENVISFQLWNANDTDHRLKPQKLLNIIALSENSLHIEDLDIEVEYQSNTIGKYNLGFDGKDLLLLAKQTDCLAPDKCGIPVEKQKIKLSELSANNTSCCTPGGKCC